MDDQFDRRLEKNGISNPEAEARKLLDVVSKTGGVAVVDYHARGMNADFFPRYGPWLRAFVAKHVRAEYTQLAPAAIRDDYVAHEASIEACSRDRLPRPQLQVANQ